MPAEKYSNNSSFSYLPPAKPQGHITLPAISAVLAQCSGAVSRTGLNNPERVESLVEQQETLAVNPFFFGQANLTEEKLSSEDKLVLCQFLSGGLDGLWTPFSEVEGHMLF